MGKKEKAEAAAEDAVRDYVMSRNRPFNVQLVFDNLRGEVKRSLVQGALEGLAAKGTLTEKVFNKFKIYFPNQENLPVRSSDELRELDARILQHTERLREVQAEAAELERELASVLAQPSDDELERTLVELRKEMAEKDAALAKLQHSAQLVSAEEMEKARGVATKLSREYRKRKRLCNEIIDRMSEGTGRKKAHLIEEMGVEPEPEHS